MKPVAEKWRTGKFNGKVPVPTEEEIIMHELGHGWSMVSGKGYPTTFDRVIKEQQSWIDLKVQFNVKEPVRWENIQRALGGPQRGQRPEH